MKTTSYGMSPTARLIAIAIPLIVVAGILYAVVNGLADASAAIGHVQHLTSVYNNAGTTVPGATVPAGQ